MVDYSKWNNIEVSDDEDETHPNIDNEALFRWRHKDRIRRMMEMERKKRILRRNKKLVKINLEDLEKREREGKIKTEQLEQSRLEILNEKAKLDREEQELKEEELRMPKNVDTLSSPVYNKSLINASSTNPDADEDKDEQLFMARIQKFFKEHGEICEKFSLLRTEDESKDFLLQHPELLHENASHCLVHLAIMAGIDNEIARMNTIAYQCLCLQFILQSSKQLNMHPITNVPIFYRKVKDTDNIYAKHFFLEFEKLKIRIGERVQEKLNAAYEELNAANREERLGPGGLDPLEVFDELPENIQKSLELKDKRMLDKILLEMSCEDATFYYKRLVDSGLWVPAVNKNYLEEEY